MDTTKLELVRDMVVLGLGIGVSFPIYTIVVQSSFDRSKLGVATATIQLFRSIGSTVGVAIMGSVMNNALADPAHQCRLGSVRSDDQPDEPGGGDLRHRHQHPAELPVRRTASSGWSG